jgi:hypothetical protein
VQGFNLSNAFLGPFSGSGQHKRVEDVKICVCVLNAGPGSHAVAFLERLIRRTRTTSATETF